MDKSDNSDRKVFPIDDDDLFTMVVSSNECTGLMPTPPRTQDDVDSYTDIYNIPQPGNSVPGALKRKKTNQSRKTS